MNVTNSNGMKSCASAEASVSIQLTLLYKAYNQLVRILNKAKNRIWSLPLGTGRAG